MAPISASGPPQAIRPQGPTLRGPVLMAQWWRDVTFVHWRLDADLVTPFLPAGARPDLFDGSAWVGLIPFRMEGAGLGRRVRVPWLGDFWETNVRVYSTDDRGRRGVTFLSLEAQRAAVVLGARTAFNVPYYWARMSGRATGSQRHYETDRSRPHRSRASSRLSVVVGERVAEPGPLQLFLTARFGLHTSYLGRSLWVPNTHAPWPLHQAVLTRLEDDLVHQAGLPDLPRTSTPDSVLFSPGVRTEFGLPRPL
jgi:uncharacterized protein